MVDPDVEVLMNLLPKTPFHSVVITKFVPLDLEGDPPEPPRGATIAFVQHVVPYYRPFRRPLNHPKYKKNFDSNVHVRVFKVAIKANGETIDEEIANLFNFMLRDNASNWYNHIISNYRFADLEQAFCR